MQTAIRQPDETTCFSCDSTIKRDVGFCPQCGTKIAAGPATPARSIDQDPRSQAASLGAQQDVAGAGRYILNFLLAGFIGLGLTFFLRKQGWLATWISIPIFILVAIVFATSVAA